MSTKIRLVVWQRPDAKDPRIVVTRLLCRVAFYCQNGRLTEPFFAIVDTGAPTSLIPCA